MTKPQLYVFAISHYCEKAIWALEFLGVDFELRHLPPGVHMAVAKKLGAKASSLPILVVDGETLQGSEQILDWADAARADARPSLIPEAGEASCRELERRLDQVLGVHIRRLYYSEALVEQPGRVRPIFERGLGRVQRSVLWATWGLVRGRMIERMDLGPEQREDSRTIVDAELAWLDALLGSRSFLVGDRFSRADLTAASLISPLVAPPEHPVYSNLELPPKLRAEVTEWEERPSLEWTREIYRDYRTA